MVGSLAPAVLAGLAVGVGLIIMIGVMSSYSQESLPPSSLSGPYTQSQKTIVRIALANNTVQELFHGNEMETGVVRPTGGIDSILTNIIS